MENRKNVAIMCCCCWWISVCSRIIFILTSLDRAHSTAHRILQIKNWCENKWLWNGEKRERKRQWGVNEIFMRKSAFVRSIGIHFNLIKIPSCFIELYDCYLNTFWMAAAIFLLIFCCYIFSSVFLIYNALGSSIIIIKNKTNLRSFEILN